MQLGRLLAPEQYLPALWDLRSDEAAAWHWREMFRLHADHLLRMLGERRGPGERERARVALEAMFRELGALDPADRQRWPTVHDWTLLRDGLLREAGIGDPYLELKEEENAVALELVETLVGEVLAPIRLDDALRLAVAGIFAGNLFDAGSPAAVQANASAGDRFARARARWLGPEAPIPALSGLCRAIEALPAQARVLFLADNAGADFLCGLLPLALLLARRGLKVTIAANELPSLNDVTAVEARALLARLEGRLPALAQIEVVSTGTGSPGIDLRDVSPALDAAAAAASLLVIEGQGRALETNWRARLGLPVLRIATIKDRCVAEALARALFDPLLELRAAGEPVPRRGRTAVDSTRPGS